MQFCDPLCNTFTFSAVMKSAHVQALHYVVDWLAKPETREQLTVKTRFSRTCRAGAEHFDPTSISFDQHLMEDEEDDVRRTLEQEREEMRDAFEA